MVRLTFPAAFQYIAYELACTLLVCYQTIIDRAADVVEDILP